MNRYELTYIIDTALEETARKELIEKVSALIAANGGEVEKVDEEPWGKGAKRLAYPINYKTEGWYVLVTFKAPADLPRELERNLDGEADEEERFADLAWKPLKPSKLPLMPSNRISAMTC